MWCPQLIASASKNGGISSSSCGSCVNRGIGCRWVLHALVADGWLVSLGPSWSWGGPLLVGPERRLVFGWLDHLPVWLLLGLLLSVQHSQP